MAFFTAPQLAILAATRVHVDFLAEFQFQSETVRLWRNGTTELVSGGHAWKPAYGTATIDGLGMSGGAISEVVTFTLKGIPDQVPDILGLALSESLEVAQRLVIVYMQMFDEDWQAVGSPIGIFWGFMQPPQVTRTPPQGDEGSTQSITVTAETAFFNRSKPPFGRYTDRDQQQRAPGDKFFQFTPSLLFKDFVWPDY